ncbi:MAG: amino acid permease [Alphaproteobacteria bacterium]|nr:amino acid permease [Alphaproteobacteria bacterium]
MLKNNAPQRIGFWPAVWMLVGNTVGLGVLVLPKIAHDMGIIGVVASVFVGCGALVLAMFFAKSARVLPSVSGPASFVYLTGRNILGNAVLAIYWFATVLGTSYIVALLIDEVLGIAPQWQYILLGFSFIWCITLTQIRSVQEVGWIQSALALMKFFPLCGAVMWACTHSSDILSYTWSMPESSCSKVMGASVILMWSFIGIESVSTMVKNVRNKYIESSTFTGVMIVVVLYVSVAVSAIVLLPAGADLNDKTAMPMLLSAVYGDWVHTCFSVWVIVMITSSIYGWFFLQGSLAKSLAQTGFLPAVCKKERSGSPFIGLMLSGTCMSILTVLASFDLVYWRDMFVLVTSLSVLVCYGSAVIAVLFGGLMTDFPQLKKQKPIAWASLIFVLLAVLGSINTIEVLIAACLWAIAVSISYKRNPLNVKK